MSIPGPILALPKVPGVIVIGLLAAQILIFGNGGNTEPKCTLKVERPHYSTSLSESKNINAIKLNISTSCNVPQKYTEISSSIQKIKNNRQVTAFQFELTRREPSKKNPNVVIFKDLYAPCSLGITTAYSGEARGFVYLEGGKRYAIKETSGKFIAADCLIGAQ